MHTTHKRNCSLTDDHRGLSTFASDIGLAPGEWPQMISVIDDQNEGFLFMRSRTIAYGEGADREFGGYEYDTKDGSLRLSVFND